MGIRMTNIATPMPQLRAKFTNKLGIPLSGCKVYTYEPGSNIPKKTWIDIDKTVENTNPILLDAAGEADIYLNGLYRIVVKDRFGFTVYDVEKTGSYTELNASFVVDASGKNQQQINNITLSSVNVLSYGAKPDADPVSCIGSDNFNAFKNAIHEASTTGKRIVEIPAGDWYIKLTNLKQMLDLSDSGNAFEGVRIRGAGRKITRIWVDAESEENVLFYYNGGSGGDTGRAITGVQIKAIPANQYKGVAIQLNGACFSLIDDFIIGNMHVGIDLLNGTGPGTFTEFNTISNGRLYRNNINRRYRVQGGDNSFHANNIINVQNQIKPGGIGVKVHGVTQAAYLYNSMWLEQYFGGTNCTMLDIESCNTDNLWGNLTREEALIIKARGGYANFEFKGDLDGIVGSITYDVESDASKGFGDITFNNTSSLSGKNFSNAAITAYAPSVLSPYLADRHVNAAVAAVYKIGDGLGLNCYSGSIGWLFTNSAFGANIVAAAPVYKFNANGTEIRSYASSLTITSGESGVVLGSSIVYPTGNYALGGANGRWASLGLNGVDFSFSSLKTHNPNALTIGASNAAVANIFLQNAPVVVSDERHKSNIQAIPEELLDAWGDLNFSMWQLSAAIEKKGEAGARWHTGFIAQQVRDALLAHGLDWTKYGLITYETWEADEYREAGEMYMLRMEECFAVEMAYQRRRMDRIELTLSNLSN